MTDASLIAYLAVVGVAVGSFMNVAIDRLPRGESLVSGKSHCDACSKRIELYALTPLLAYLWLRGRCRYCGARIPVRVPVVEAGAGALFGAAAYLYGANVETLIAIVNISVFLIIFFIDMEHRLILNKVLLAAFPVALVTFPWGPVGMEHSVGEAYLRCLVGVGTGFGAMLLVYVASRGGMGEGDVKMGGLMGAVLGFPHILAAFFIAFVVSGLTALALMKIRGMKRKDVMPFGPFLAASAIALLLAGEGAYGWYLDLLGR
ncbi:MAG: prepilin peptidase [SAR202 cluster bacterium]|nr:prepilin peptidase [SAR202 cluster bacterium]